MNVDDIVAEKIEAARIRIAAAKRRRTELTAARQRGLAARHAAKLRNLAARVSDETPAAPDLTEVQAQLERIAQRLEATTDDPEHEP